MNHFTDEQWDRLFEVLQGIREGKTIQWQNPTDSEWLDDKPNLHDLALYPLRYRVKPETVTVYVYRARSGNLTINNSPEFQRVGSWELLYTFEHEVQQ